MDELYWLLLLLFSCSVMSITLQLQGLQDTKLPCPSPSPGVCSVSCLLSWWCHPTILSSVVPFSSCLLSFPASGSFPMSQFFTSGCQMLQFQLQNQSFQWIFRTDWIPTRPARTNTLKRCPFHHRGLKCKSRKSRDTRSNRKLWPWSTKWSRAKAKSFAKRTHWS